MTKCTDFCQYCTNFCFFANYGAIVPGELTCACCKIVACTPWRNRPYALTSNVTSYFRRANSGESIRQHDSPLLIPRAPNRTCMACLAPQIHPCALRLKQPAAALPRAPNRTCMACLPCTPNPSVRSAAQAACYGSSARPKSHVHGMGDFPRRHNACALPQSLMGAVD
jgi:hypothetical protein